MLQAISWGQFLLFLLFGLLLYYGYVIFKLKLWKEWFPRKPPEKEAKQGELFEE